MNKLKIICSGGQTGADLAGLKVAKSLNIPTGGTMPKGFINHTGKHPEFADLYNMVEDSSPKYQPRTEKNVVNSDGTIRIAGNFFSPGEVCTLRYIIKHRKPYFDVDLRQPITDEIIEEFLYWMEENNIEVLNVAGNAERTYPGTEKKATEFLMKALKCLKEQ